MSVFEPLGGILCANLPIIYSLFAPTIQKWRSNITSGLGWSTRDGKSGKSGSSKSARSGRSGSGFRRPYDSDKYADKWMKLPNWNRGADDYTSTTVESVKNPVVEDTVALPMNSIVAKTEWSCESEKKT